jgi:hypothetical protein
VDIDKKVKLAIDETRMLALGAQILVGFQFRGAFETAFEHLPPWSRRLDGVALLLMVTTLALLVLPGPFHRLVEAGNDSGDFHRLVTRVACLALAPFAASLGIDVAIVGERLFGAAGGLAAGAVFAALAVFFWFGLEAWRKRSIGETERAMATRKQDAVKQTPLHQKTDLMLTEARVILPGAQALLGFQLAIMLTEAFETLAMPIKLVHGAALGCIGLSVILLMAPAAYHRIVYDGEDAAAFHRTGSRFVTWSTLPLALGLACDVFVVATRIVPSTLGAALAAAAVLAPLVGCWHALPLIARRRRQTASRVGARAPEWSPR